MVAGRTSLAESVASIEESLASLLSGLGASGSVLPAPRRANLRGALDMGLSPGLLPGRVTLAEGGDWYRRHWGDVPANEGLDTVAILKAAAEGRITALVMLGADPLTDVIDSTIAAAAFGKLEHIIAVDTFANESVNHASVILPAAGFAEKSGTHTNIEGRVSRLAAKVSPPGVARPDWMIAVELGVRLGIDLKLESVDDITEEISRVVPSHLGLDMATLTAPGRGDGIVVPLPSVGSTTESDSDTAHSDTADANALQVPAFVTASGAPASVVPQPDSYSLRLVSSHLFYDDGTRLQSSPSLAKLAAGTALHLHPGEIERHGLSAGGSVKVLSQRCTVVLTVKEDAQVPRGSAFVPFGQRGGDAAQLIDLDELATTGVVKIRLETVGDN